MKQNNKIIFFVVLSIILLIIVINYRVNKKSYVEKTYETQSINEEKELTIQWESNLEIVEMLLPEINYEQRKEEITHIVIHYISNVYNNKENPYNINDIYNILEEYELSSHYVIDRNGEIYLFTPEDKIAYHAGKGILEGYLEYENKLNLHSIGIELLAIGTEEEMSNTIDSEEYNLLDQSMIGYTDEQYEALNRLIDDIVDRHEGIIKDRNHIIGHDEYNLEKTDPGILFNWEMIEL